MKAMKTAITPTRKENYPEWYQAVVREADMAENSDVRGCMVIKPWGYGIWENIQKILDEMFQETGHKNAYFPLFIPLSFMQKEAEHVEGFAKECAVVTHHRLSQNAEGTLVPDGELEEPLIVRPTSETIIGAAYARWVKSWRDLPILINQWANVVRWEMRTRIFLRTAEFLWQEGHTVHATQAEAEEETLKMLEVYRDFVENSLAIPVIKGRKSEGEKFPGAVDTYSIEAMMQDRKALQAGTSHFLGQNFAKSSGIRFQNQSGDLEYAWTTSWGMSTRLIGALIMSHSDDNGLVVPPAVAPSQVVILPIYRNPEEREVVMAYVKKLQEALKTLRFREQKIRVELDDRDLRGGEKSWQWIKKGVPIKVEIGPRDVEKNSLAVVRRDSETLKAEFIPFESFISGLVDSLEDLQKSLFNKAKTLRDENTKTLETWDELIAWFTPKNADQPEIHGGFALSPWCGCKECEEKLANYKITIRNIPLDQTGVQGNCVICGKEAKHRVILAKSY